MAFFVAMATYSIYTSKKDVVGLIFDMEGDVQ